MTNEEAIMTLTLVTNLLQYEVNDNNSRIIEAVNFAIDSLKNTRPKGEWIPMEVSSGRDSWKCSVCGRRARGKLNNLPFCHCGADMREADNETN